MNCKELSWQEFYKLIKKQERKERKRRLNMSKEELKREDEEKEEYYKELMNLEMEELNSIIHGIYSSADCGIDW